MDNNGKNALDQLDALISKQASVLTGDSSDLDENIQSYPSTPEEIETNNTDEDMFVDPMDDMDITSLDIDYGEDDMQKLMEEEDRLERERIEELRRVREINMQENDRQPKAVTSSLDTNYQIGAIKFQSDKFSTLKEMVESVKNKHGIKTEEIHIPESKQHMLTGELLDIYHNLQDGDLIPKEFEDLILKYWIKGTTSDNPPPYITEKTTNEFVPEGMNTTININVKAGQPVVVNVDKDLIPDINNIRELTVNVREIDYKDMHVVKVVENSNDTTILEPYKYNVGDTPIVLLTSAYRCTMEAVNWGKIMNLSVPIGENQSDIERQQWSVLFEQVKNVSIGEFKATKTVNMDKSVDETSAFENFLKASKYKDRELLMWAILVSTSKETEELELTCMNRSCHHKYTIEYSPRAICHIDIPPEDKRLLEMYRKTGIVAAGDEALAHWNDVHNTRRMYHIPDSDWYAEITEPSAYMYINQCLPLLQKLYERFRPGEKFTDNISDLDHLPQFTYLAPHVLYVRSFSKIVDGTEYRYDKWEKIEDILINRLTMAESNILLKLIEKFTTKSNPVRFYLSDVKCPKCEDRRDKLIINNIAETLLFHLSQRQANMPIEIVEMP